MKNLISSVLFVIVSVFGFSQTKIDSTLVNYTLDIPYVAFDIVVKDIKKINKIIYNENLYFSSNLKSYKKVKRSFYFYAAPQFNYVKYSDKKQKSELGILRYCKVVDSTFVINYFKELNDETTIKVVQLSNNEFGAIINKRNKKGKVKTFISTNVIFNKKSFQ
jgi:hypothetical protein